MLASIPLIIEAGIQLLVSLVEALPEIIEAIVEALPLLINGIIDGLIGNIDKIIEAGVTLLIALVENTPKIIVEIVKAIPKIIKGIVTAIIEAAPKIAEAGGNLIKGLWQGIKDVTSWLWDKIKGFCSDIVSKIKNFFGINSPSTLFAGIGGFLGEGLGIGFVSTMGKVAKDMQNAIPTRFDVSPSINAGFDAVGEAGSGYFGHGSMAGGGAPVINVTQHIYAEDTSYAEQQRQAKRQAQLLAREVFA